MTDQLGKREMAWGWAHIQTDRQTDRQTEREADRERQTDRETGRQRQRQRERERPVNQKLTITMSEKLTVMLASSS